MYIVKTHIEIEIKHLSDEISFDEYFKYNKEYFKENEFNTISKQVKEIIDSIICETVLNVHTQCKDIDDFYNKNRKKFESKSSNEIFGEEIDKMNKSYLDNESILKEVFNKNSYSIEKIKSKSKYVNTLIDEFRKI